MVCPPDSNDPDTILELLAIALDKTRGVPAGILPDLEATLQQRTRVAAWRSNTRTVLHFLNYNIPLGRKAAGTVPTLRNVAVNLTLPTTAPAPTTITLHTPEPGVGSEGPIPFQRHGHTLNFRLPTWNIHQIADIR